jgi:hypothetical protein
MASYIWTNFHDQDARRPESQGWYRRRTSYISKVSESCWLLLRLGRIKPQVCLPRFSAYQFGSEIRIHAATTGKLRRFSGTAFTERHGIPCRIIPPIIILRPLQVVYIVRSAYETRRCRDQALPVAHPSTALLGQ